MALSDYIVNNSSNGTIISPTNCTNCTSSGIVGDEEDPSFDLFYNSTYINSTTLLRCDDLFIKMVNISGFKNLTLYGQYWEISISSSYSPYSTD